MALARWLSVIDWGCSEIRILLVFDPWRSAVLLVAGDKAGQARGSPIAGQRTAAAPIKSAALFVAPPVKQRLTAGGPELTPRLATTPAGLGRQGATTEQPKSPR